MATKLPYLVGKQAKNDNYFIGQNFSEVHANAPANLATRIYPNSIHSTS